jgi:hypothetical protein
MASLICPKSRFLVKSRRGHAMSDRESNQEYVWRFRLDEKPLKALNSDPLLELLRVQWEELLKLCIPVCGDKWVKIDGFVLMRDLDVVHPIFPDDPRWDE